MAESHSAASDHGRDNSYVGPVRKGPPLRLAKRSNAAGVWFVHVGDRLSLGDGSDDAVAPVQELFGEVAAKAAADTGDGLDTLCQNQFPPGGAISLTVLSPLSVRG